MKSQTYPESIPTAYAGNEHTSQAYRKGWNTGHGIACHNVPTLGEKIFSESLGRVTVDAENIREVHESACFEAEMSGRDFSPFEFTAHEFNQAGEGGFRLCDPDGNEVGMFDTADEANAHADKAAEDAEDRALFTVEEIPSSEELWEAYDAGVADAIHADIATYTDQDYGIEA